MSFISYAQNFEDVMLWRALKHVDQGFYIDVGANDPDQHSVTKAFYERGWRGINIEPVAQWFERLEKKRLRDINLQLALGAEPGEITLYEIPDTGLSTAEKTFAERHEAGHGFQNRELRVKMDTLSRVCERLHLAPIHFLKIDVEGAEKAVLQGVDFGKIRPWIILVEATLPLSMEASYSDWEPLLLNAGYEYVYFDGLNRFYVAGEHDALKAAFKTPPNVFDEFLKSEYLESERRAQEAEAKVREAEQQAGEANARAKQAEEEAAQAKATAQQSEVRAQQAELKTRESRQQAAQVEALARESEARTRQAEERLAHAEATLHAVLSSRSWRVTEPLRRLIGAVRPPREQGVAAVKMSFDQTSNKLYPAPPMTKPQEPDILDQSPRARKLYSQLNAAIEKNQENK